MVKRKKNTFEVARYGSEFLKLNSLFMLTGLEFRQELFFRSQVLAFNLKELQKIEMANVFLHFLLTSVNVGLPPMRRGCW